MQDPETTTTAAAANGGDEHGCKADLWALETIDDDEWEAANRSRRREQQLLSANASASCGGADTINVAEAYALLLDAAMRAPERRAAAEASLAAAQQSAGWGRTSRRVLAFCHNFLLRWWRRCRRRRQPCGGSELERHDDDDEQQQQLYLDRDRWQRVNLLALAATPLDWADPLHRHAMAALHGACAALAAAAGRPLPVALGPEAVAAPGPHWQALGFQGDDPATDLRAAGMFGVAQLLAFAQSPTPPAAAAAAWRILCSSLDSGACSSSGGGGGGGDNSASSSGGLPFALVSLNISTWAVTALRCGALKSHCGRVRGRRGPPLPAPLADAADAFYAGAWRELCAALLRGARPAAASRRAAPAAAGPLVLQRLKQRAQRAPHHFLSSDASKWEAIIRKGLALLGEAAAR